MNQLLLGLWHLSQSFAEFKLVYNPDFGVLTEHCDAKNALMTRENDAFFSKDLATLKNTDLMLAHYEISPTNCVPCVGFMGHKESLSEQLLLVGGLVFFHTLNVLLSSSRHLWPLGSSAHHSRVIALNYIVLLLKSICIEAVYLVDVVF